MPGIEHLNRCLENLLFARPHWNASTIAISIEAMLTGNGNSQLPVKSITPDTIGRMIAGNAGPVFMMPLAVP